MPITGCNSVLFQSLRAIVSSDEYNNDVYEKLAKSVIITGELHRNLRVRTGEGCMWAVALNRENGSRGMVETEDICASRGCAVHVTA